MEHILREPFTEEKMSGLKAGDTVLLTGTVYSARDAAHRRLVEMLDSGSELPFDVKNAMVYYAGPTPAKPGYPIGSAGPTTSYRMDSFTPRMLDAGLIGTIGKGPRSDEVAESIMKRKAVYFAAVGGAAALIAQSVKSAEVVAFEDLGTEAIRRIHVENMPLVVALDCHGGNIYREVYNP